MEDWSSVKKVPTVIHKLIKKENIDLFLVDFTGTQVNNKHL